jgi:hypothetical protein
MFVLGVAGGGGVRVVVWHGTVMLLACTCFWGVERGRWVGLTTLPPSVSQLSRQCGILNISQPYRPPWPVIGIALLTWEIKLKMQNTHTYMYAYVCVCVCVCARVRVCGRERERERERELFRNYRITFYNLWLWNAFLLSEVKCCVPCRSLLTFEGNLQPPSSFQ